MIVAMARDIRVLVIKLADRLHNMRTLRLPAARTSRQRKARETLEIYAPLAHRLGMNAIKWELEDLVVRDPAPEGLRRDRAAGRRARAEREQYLAEVIDAGRRATCTSAEIKADGRPAARSTTTRSTRR